MNIERFRTMDAEELVEAAQLHVCLGVAKAALWAVEGVTLVTSAKESIWDSGKAYNVTTTSEAVL
ncbi:MAG: hypothetical protein QG629_874 [Patescibacteria group bacterium]|nr:hypothetical protein [Candidatus Saccharibacteria bacterium]MDQ5963791.1 hypothetical protein [Patescibacteria group bacterium]